MRRPPSQVQRRDHHHQAMPVTSRVLDFEAGITRPLHDHSAAQLIYAVQGVMVVSCAAGLWVVPPSRAIWMPPCMAHSIYMVSAVAMRTLYIRPDAAAGLPLQCHTVEISGLLRQLIGSAMQITQPYAADSRDGRLMQLILDELVFMSVLPLHLPQPADPRLQEVCGQIRMHPDEKRTLPQWAQQLAVDSKTLQRLFVRETGMTFGQWRQQARLLGALAQLALGRRILDVALDAGYDSPSAFSAMFKKQLGMAPTEYFSGGP